MFDLAWSEIALIAVVAIVVIGPKDLPDAIRGVAKGVQKLRRMAGEFQSHADELVREAKLEDVRDQIRDIRNFDLKSTIERNLDQDGEIRRTFSEDPLKDAWKPGTSTSATPAPGAAGTAEAGAPPAGDSTKAPESAPAFIPPSVVAESGRAAPEAAPFSAEPRPPLDPPPAAGAPAPVPAGAPDLNRPAETSPEMQPTSTTASAAPAAKPTSSV